jgi:hypothetical protein
LVHVIHELRQGRRIGIYAEEDVAALDVVMQHLMMGLVARALDTCGHDIQREEPEVGISSGESPGANWLRNVMRPPYSAGGIVYR